MGYIDSDCHVREPETVWEYLDPGERRYRPDKDEHGAWLIDGLPTQKAFDVAAMAEEYNTLFPEGSVDLLDVSARLKRMDVLGVDVQVLFSTFWLNVEVPSAQEEAALMRSWNRWVAERANDSGGRLLWTLEVPFRLPERAAAEMEFAKSHGAVGVHLAGFRHGVSLADPAYRPVYERAQALDLVVAVHVGGDWRKYRRDPSLTLLTNLAPIPGAFYALHTSGIPAQFPHLRWAFAEAGASWLPFTIQESSRADQWGGYRVNRNWREVARSVLADNHFYVTCQIDDDLAYLRGLVGTANLVHGTDYSHMDLGSDPYGLHIVATHPLLDKAEAAAIVDSNARRLWRVDSSFTPAPAPELRPEVVEAVRSWTR
jgi:predicted TIM-barrel fold metal-dependent hydrolase